MGIALPQLAPASEDRASGAQVIDGSLNFEASKTQYLNNKFNIVIQNTTFQENKNVLITNMTFE